VTVAAVGGMLGAEGSIIRVTVIPMAVYTAIFAGIGMFLA
jgi:L-lactate permease